MEDLDNSSNDSVVHSIEYTVNYYERLFLELFTAVGLASVIANVLILLVILKFKKLRQEVTNIILAHLSFLQAVYLLTTPLAVRVSTLFIWNESLHGALYCVLYENELILSVVVSLFFFLLISDWYIKTYNEEKYVKFTRVYKFFVAALYISGIFLSAVNTLLCYKGYMLLTTLLTIFVTYAILIIFLIVMNIVHLVKKRRLRVNKPHVGLVITNMFFVFWIPLLVLLIFHLFGQIRIPPELSIVSSTLGFLSPVFNFFYLFCSEGDFNVFFRKIFKCQCNEYGNELLEEQVVTYNDVNGVKIEENVLGEINKS